MKTEFRFQSRIFNCTESRDYFLNKDCFGDDVVRWLIVELKRQCIKTAEHPDQEDFGWYFTFFVEGKEHCVVIVFQPNDPSIGNQWIGWIERHASFVGSLLGQRNRGVLPNAIAIIDSVLKSSPEIEKLSWHEHQ